MAKATKRIAVKLTRFRGHPRIWTCPGFVERWVFGIRVVGFGAIPSLPGRCMPLEVMDPRIQHVRYGCMAN
jgi:hypothetical protein